MIVRRVVPLRFAALFAVPLLLAACSPPAPAAVLTAREHDERAVRWITLDPMPGTEIGIPEMARYGTLSYERESDCWHVEMVGEPDASRYAVGWVDGVRAAEPSNDSSIEIIVPKGDQDQTVATGEVVVFSGLETSVDQIQDFPERCLTGADAVMWVGDLSLAPEDNP